MRFWLCLVLTACGVSPEPSPVPAPGPAKPAPPPPAPAPPPPPPLTGSHGSEIIALAVTSDGDAVVSADREGGIRLWTALDGTREPIVINGTVPRSLALLHDGDGFAIAVLDLAGGVHVIRTSAAGAVRDRVTVAGAQPAVELGGTTEGLLILRSDQTVELVDAAGAVRSHLEPDPGSHLESILVRGRRALALVLEDKQLHGRWIVLDHGARWGDATPKLEGKIAHAVLAPGGGLLAVTRPRSVHPALIDLAKGTALKTPLCVTRGWPRDVGMDMDEREFLQNNNAPLPLAFLSDSVVACSVMNALLWWNTDGTPVQTGAGSFNVTGSPFDVSDRALVVGMGPNLAIGTAAFNRFLGYGLHDITHMRAGPAGLLIGGNEQQSLVLGADLADRARFDLGRNRVDWTDAIAIDDRYAITATSRRGFSRSDGTQIAVFDGVAAAQHQALPYEARDRELAYEPATRLLATSDGPVSLLLRFDPVTHTFGKPIRIASAITSSKLRVVDPGLANGVAALEIDDSNDGILVGELADGEVTPGAVVQPHTTYRVPGELRAVDRAGRLYMRAAGAPDVVVYAHGVAGPRLPGVGPLVLRPNRDGSQIAAFESPRLVLLTSAGSVRWEAAHWGGSDVDWTAAGELVVVFPSAIAKVDLDTGAMAARRCGWSFGASDQPTEIGRGSPSICDAAK
jgi:hypothetical protein